LAVNDARRDRRAVHLPMRQRPFARATNRLEAVVHFCRVWCASWSYYLERARRAGIAGSPRFTDSEYQPAEAENPLSAAQDAVTFGDPYPCHLVLVPGPGV
jgi:hypothetical protein